MDTPLWVFIVLIVLLALSITVSIFLIYFFLRFLISVPTSLKRIAAALEKDSDSEDTDED